MKEHQTKRSERRYRTQCIKEQRKSYWGWWKKTDAQLGVLSKTAKPCSCWMCGNPRKHWKQRTLKEELHRIIEKEVDD